MIEVIHSFLPCDFLHCKNFNDRWRHAPAKVHMGLVGVIAVFLGAMGWSQESPTSIDRSEDKQAVEYFESKIRPVLVQQCYECHSVAAKDPSGELLLDSKPAMLRGGSRGNVLAGETLDAKLLWKALQYDDQSLQMPPSGKLSHEVLDDFRRWIESGAVDPRREPQGVVGPSHWDQIETRSKLHWAYQRPTRHERPTVKQIDWPRESFDWYVLARLEAQSMAPAAPADRRTLIRRLYYDLLGLPPSYEAIRDFEKDDGVDAYERLVDSLLKSQHFGERMARRWMDVTRYADTKGYVFQEDRQYPHAYRYRDWLIRALNQDMPYSDFVRYQLVADRLDPDNAKGHLDAMGMLTLGRRFLNNKNDIADDRIDVVSRGLMAMTVGCARCHDHKFDPVSMKDYYSMQGVFLNSEEPGGEPSPLRLADREKKQAVHILLRGQPGNRGEAIEPHFVSVLAKDQPIAMNDGSGRIDLANAIIDVNNPLTYRVYVNRVWGWIWGAHLVDTPSDFGLRSEAPLHLDVLDELTLQFQESGLSTKELVRHIVCSATYRQSSSKLSPSTSSDRDPDPDPENRWLARANRKRMDFESYRDAMLMVGGNLDQALGGPSEPIHEEPFSQRRTLYAYIDRQNLPGVFRSFDFVSPDAHAPQRSMTTVPQQGLFIMNSEAVQRIAAEVAKQLPSLAHSPDQRASDDNIRESIDMLFKRILARKPMTAEWKSAIQYLESIEEPVDDLPRLETPWHYGYAKYESTSKQIDDFKALPIFHDARWSGGTKVPDAKLGWAMLNATGGHPGEKDGFAVVRRWIAPRSGKLEVRGDLKHSSDAGDGVRGTIIVDRSQAIDSWTVKKESKTTSVDSIELVEGQSLDFVCDCLESEDSDSFQWIVRLRFTEGDRERFHSQRDFAGPVPKPLNAWAQLAQALMATNEFCFVD